MKRTSGLTMSAKKVQRLGIVTVAMLKANRDEIIAEIERVDGPTRIKQIMQIMVNACETNSMVDYLGFDHYIWSVVTMLGPIEKEISKEILDEQMVNQKLAWDASLKFRACVR